uniref:Uncharacterized protein n=1 Tax=Brassica oleracea var. oleracea TaxID=109376 RepID=A0A0D3ED68_BRAOL
MLAVRIVSIENVSPAPSPVEYITFLRLRPLRLKPVMSIQGRPWAKVPKARVLGARVRYLSGVRCFSPSPEKDSLLSLVFLWILHLCQLMLGIASPWLGQSLVVFDVLFLVVGLPSIVFARLAFIASLVALPFTMFATRGLDSVFVRVCHVGLEGVRSYSLGALVFSIQSFVFFHLHGRVVCPDRYNNVSGMEGEKSSGGGKKAGIAFGVIAAASIVCVGGYMLKKRRDNIRRS